MSAPTAYELEVHHGMSREALLREVLGEVYGHRPAVVRLTDDEPAADEWDDLFGRTAA